MAHVYAAQRVKARFCRRICRVIHPVGPREVKRVGRRHERAWAAVHPHGFGQLRPGKRTARGCCTSRPLGYSGARPEPAISAWERPAAATARRKGGRRRATPARSLHPSHRVALELPRLPPVQGHEQVAPEQPPWGSADGASRPGWRRAISSIAASRRTYSERWRSSRRRSATVMPAPALAAWPGPRRGRSARRSGSARTARRSGASRCSPSTPDRRAWRRPCRRTRGSRSAP